jgi:hypothetical protein
MPIAFSVLPDRFADDRHGAIERGLASVGYGVRRVAGSPEPTASADVLVTWTVHRGHKEQLARRFEAAGGRVIVAEEGYIRRVNGEKHFALALHDHNGAGKWHLGGPERWEGFGITLAPWRRDGRHILVTEQRSIGSEAMASPADWHLKVTDRLRAFTDRPIVIRWHPKSRKHPAKAESQPSFAEQLADCWAMVTWNSAAAVEALVAGVPVYFEAPRAVWENAAHPNIRDIERPMMVDRLSAFRRLAWAQWSVREIESGEPFNYLLSAVSYQRSANSVLLTAEC